MFAFGARWLTFRHARRRELRDALRGADASHWLRLADGDVIQIGAYRLAGEKGRIHGAAEAARNRFGGDFLGLFEIGGESFARAWWLVALSEEIVLCDSLHDTADGARTALARFQDPNRAFGTVCLPEAFGGQPGSAIPLGEFLDLARTPLRRAGERRPALLLGGLLSVAIAAALWQGAALLAGAPAATSPEAAAERPVLPLRISPEALAFACETAVAARLFGPRDGWVLTAARCTPDSLVLRLSSPAPGAAPPPGTAGGRVSVAHSGTSADLRIPGTGATERLDDLPPERATLRALRRSLRLLDRNFRLAPVRHATAVEPYDTHQFAFETRTAAPVWLAALGGIGGLELAALRFLPEGLRWRVEGNLHVRPQ